MKGFFSLYLFYIIWITFQSNNLYSQNNTQGYILFDSGFFDTEQPVEIQLKFNIKEYMSDKKEQKYVSAVLSFYTPDSVLVNKDVKLKSRGESRLRHCHFPPFWLNIKGAGLHQKKVFSKKIKVVTNCRAGRAYDDYLLSEYFIYKVYNVITDYSFKVRLVKIKYIDTGRKNKETETWAFMIEPEEMLADRIEAVQVEMDNLSYRHTDSLHIDILCFFQYMMGNTDFSIAGRHNIKLFKSTDHLRPNLIPIAYDFDFAGLINTAYATAAEELHISGVRERYYLGKCRPEEHLSKIIELYKQKENEIYDLIENEEYLSKNMKINAKEYIEEFYTILHTRNFIKRYIGPTCFK